MSDKPSILHPGDFGNYTTSDHGIQFAETTPQNEWLSVVQRLCGMYEGTELARQRTLMLLADALNFGESAYGESFAQSIDNTRQALGLSPKTIANAQAVYRKIPVEKRRDGITLGHYSVISSLEPDEQDRFSEQILIHKYTVSDLKEVVAEAHPKTKRGKTRKAAQANDTAESALQKLTDSMNWLDGVDLSLLAKDWKAPLEKAYRIYRRRWQGKGKR